MPAIKKPSEHFDVKLYTGNQPSTNAITGLGFSPGLVWTKSKSSAESHNLVDSVRGNNLRLRSNETVAEAAATFTLDSNGFTVGSNSESNNGSMVGWTWKAGGAAVANTAGSIASQVSVNPTAGFSVVTYTSPNTSVDETVGHGLNATPQFIITKNRDASFNWDIYHKNLSSGNDLTFEPLSQQSGRWSTTLPTDSVFTVKYNYEHASTNKYVAYCWTPIAGYSAFGTYTGNNATGGPFVYTGFRPRFILLKGLAATDWYIYDTARNTSNLSALELNPNLAAVEQDGIYGSMDILSNGFKLRFAGGEVNASGVTYIYAAFAEAPFKFANAR
jgi:hypothetical protein